jgi:two-component system phosphate regulon sensor histidine kinase PhoR
MKSRLFRKIFAGYALIILVVISLDSFLVATHTRRDITDQIKQELMSEGQVMLLMPLEQIIHNIQRLSEVWQARLTVVNAAGQVLADSDREARNLDSHLDRPEIQEARVKGQGSAVRYSQTLRIDMMYVAFPVRAAGQITGYIRLAKPLQEVESAISHFYRIVFRAAVIILVSFLVLALFFIPRLISPLLRIKDYTERVRGQETPGSLLIYSRDEIGQLADNINLLVQTYTENIRIAREEREKLAAVFASMTEGIVILNRENRIELVNRGGSDILGNKYEDITGKTLMEAFRNVELQNALDACRSGDRPFSQEISLGDDNLLLLNVNIAPIKGLPEEESKTIMAFHNLTQLRKLERVRADFVANVTHEIRTPLTAIIGFVQTLQDGAMGDKTEAARFLSIIAANAQRLNRLVDDLLTLSRIELGEAGLRLEKVDVRDAVLQAIAVIEGQAKAKGLAIRQDWPDDLPPILADADSLLQILLNVLDNAVKFTPSGSIAVAISVDACRGGLETSPYMVITIADSGIGIPKQEIARLGERFYRVDKMRSRELGGTGLGLSIVKHLLKAHRGWMEVESQPGTGTTVKLIFPIDA